MRKLIAVLVLLFATSPARADIIWAAAGPYTGAAASYGLSQQEGIKQVVEGINANGGLNGQKIVVKFYDDACDPKQAVAVANKIIADNIHVVLQGTCSASNVAALKTYVDEGVLVLTTLASNPKVSDEGSANTFRAMYRDDNAAAVLADELLKHHRNTKLAIIHDKSTYGQGIAEMVREGVNKSGLKEILFEPYDPANHDYAALVSRLRQAGVDTLFVGGFPVEIAMITRQLRETGSNIQIYAGDLSGPDYWKIAGKTGNGALSIFPPDPFKQPSVKEVMTKLQKAGIVVDGYMLYAYAATQALAQATTKAASSDPARLAEALHGNEFNTILGKWSFDAKGDVRGIRLVMYRWQDGRFEETGE